MQHRFTAQRCDVSIGPASADGPSVSLSGQFTLNGEVQSEGTVRFVVNLPTAGVQDAQAVIFPRGGPNDKPELSVRANAAKRSELAAALLGDLVAGAVEVSFTTRSPILVTAESGTTVDAAGVSISHAYRQG